MKIDEVIKKCMQVPGISLRQQENHVELLLNQPDGRGSMMFIPLFPGVTFAFIEVHCATWPAPKLQESIPGEKGPLLINYCISGRCELILNNENYVYVTENQISLTERFAQDRYIYPLRLYEGMEFFIDTDAVRAREHVLAGEFGLDIQKLIQRYCSRGKTYISACTPAAEALFQEFWKIGRKTDAGSLLQMKALTLSLLGLLFYEKEVPPSQICTFYTESQVEIAKRTEKLITANLKEHHPAWELAARFSISETSLKNYFRGVFGQNISVYLREVRMKKAAWLLETTKDSVAEIAEQVGYGNQSKFAAVFRKQFDCSPLEYRRSSRLKGAKEE